MRCCATLLEGSQKPALAFQHAMAIAFARARYLSRASGGNAVRSAAYNAREAITAERTGELFHFRHRDAPEHHEVLLPEGTDARLADNATLWNAAEAAERRKDAQVAREIVLALPADRVLSTEDRIELARSFAQEHFVSKGLAVQLDVHAPHKDRGEGEGVWTEGTGGDHTNWHAHLLITTRRIEGDRLAAKKARDLDPEVRRAGTRTLVTDAEAWGETWRAHQDRYFAEHGIELRVDATAAHPGEHIGPVRMRKVDSPAVERAEALRTANEAAARDPEQVLAALTRNNATFTERELDRYLAKHLGAGPDGTPDAGQAQDIAAAKVAVLGHKDVLVLHDRETGEAAGRFSTRTVREQERVALADGAAVAGARHHQGVKARHQDTALRSRTLREDQRAAFEHAVEGGGLKLIEGRAGTGKSYTLAAVRGAHEAAGYRVVGLAPTNAVAQDLKEDGFTEAGTVHAALFGIKNGRTSWDRRTVVVVDEAAMLDSRVSGEVLAEAKRAGAKVILSGDDRQLASIERGGLFTELRKQHGAAEITEVTRQKVDWQREAARDLAEGRFDSAVAAYDRHGAITWTGNGEAARAALVERWKADTLADPQASRFVFAYTNADVSRINADLRQVRRERGELGSPDVRLETKHGAADFAVGDRVQFTDTDKKRHIYNGNAGVITGIDARTGQVTARLDAAAGAAGREVTWAAAEFEGFRHGYAGTIYKGQGKTLDHTYLLHTHHWRAAASYVALTRQRESAQVFVAEDTARDAHQLARQMGRGEVRAASVAWATVDELRPELRPRDEEKQKAAEPVRRDQAPNAPLSEREQVRAFWDRTAAAGVAARTGTPARVQAQAGQDTPGAGEGWLIPPRVSPDGRDSLGRGTSAGEIAAVVAADKAVQREREARWSYLQGAYRDPHAARAALDELVKSQGWTSAAARTAADPFQLGELRGKEGFFAGMKARAEREAAQRAAGAIGPSLERIGEDEARAERTYRTGVDAQRAADATGIPRLSTAAEAAIGVVAAAPDEKARAGTWWAVQADERVASELRTFSAAVEQRFGEEGVRAMLRADGRAGAVTAGSITPEQRPELDQVAELTSALKAGERAGAASAQRQAESERQGQRRGLRM
ncbi:MobA/MobL protein [Lichenicoccus roseus]|uniref:MobA/MobL protein n=2 Tax=Lichenicoccus roseus TaxID=2683649 RepID=A0A5R9J4Y9_9PROT|nr:MobA/MobL protein [Lichenicoccus roseus]